MEDTGLSTDLHLANVKGATTACLHNLECASGFCADGYCCDRACTGTCESCDGAFNTKGTGTCSPVQAGLDPRNQCGHRTCAQDSMVSSACDGAGACQPTSESCTPYTCDSKTRACKTKCLNDNDCVTGGVCDPTRAQCVAGVVTGTCKDATTLSVAGGADVSCAPFLCAHGTCRVECATSNDCAPGNECRGQKCQSPGDEIIGTINAKRGCAVQPGVGLGAEEAWAAALSLALAGLGRRVRRRSERRADIRGQNQ